MNKHEIFLRLAEIKAAHRDPVERAQEAFRMVALSFGETPQPLDAETNRELRGELEQLYQEAIDAGLLRGPRPVSEAA